MKIGILTLPFHTNIGGILQNYALQELLRKLGYEPITINIKNRKISRITMLLSIIKRFIMKNLMNKSSIIVRIWPTANEKQYLYGGINQFINSYISLTKPIYNSKDLYKQDNRFFDAYIVGSDQVWRPSYSTNLSTFFLGFLKNNSEVIKIAYAASFGVDYWEFTSKQTIISAKLAKYFDAVSVREDSAISLCEEYLQIKATQVLDPTMLIDVDVYKSLVEKQHIDNWCGTLFTYILDKNDEKQKIIDKIALKYNLSPFSIIPQKSFSEVGKKNIQHCLYPSPEKWIKSFVDAKFIITDSFHGTVFSILFNKPFISIINNNRGSSRFTSLLKLFKLEDRLIFSYDQLINTKFNDIDWVKTNKILNTEREKSIKFILYSLTKNNRCHE